MLAFNEICSILKQKAPFVYVDKVLEIEGCKRILALKNVTGSEAFAPCHFPGNPIYPGIFIIEAVAQTASILCYYSPDMKIAQECQFLALGGLQRFQFLCPVRPGDTLLIELEAIKIVPQGAIVKAVVRVENNVVAEGQMTFGTVKNE